MTLQDRDEWNRLTAFEDEVVIRPFQDRAISRNLQPQQLPTTIGFFWGGGGGNICHAYGIEPLTTN